MKLLMFYAPSFWFKTHEKALAEAPEVDIEQTVENAVVVFYQVEAHDADDQTAAINKTIKNIKWLTRKFQAEDVVLHSFNHLSASKAPPQAAQALMEAAAQRLAAVGLTVQQTPFGYLNEWRLHAAGPALAKVFKEF